MFLFIIYLHSFIYNAIKARTTRAQAIVLTIEPAEDSASGVESLVPLGVLPELEVEEPDVEAATSLEVEEVTAAAERIPKVGS